MDRNREYFRRRAEEARAAAAQRHDDEGIEVAGYLALAYTTLARRRSEAATIAPPDPPLMFPDSR